MRVSDYKKKFTFAKTYMGESPRLWQIAVITEKTLHRYL